MDNKNVVVLGASPKEDRYSHLAMKMLEKNGYNPIPVAPKHQEILGRTVNPTLADVKENVDTVSMYVGSQRQTDIIPQIVSCRPRRVIFNPGTENPEAYEVLENAGIKIEEACTLVLLRSGQF